ncbi:MAG: ligase-associated DNA damage response exonuclease [Gemmataceae bacterium]|nr:ligase-associated DNA damage response exonuclease [Gemmataceae bacterium]
MATDLLHLTDAGLYCPEGRFHIDPWKPVERAVTTHVHADHARPGLGRYLVAADGLAVARTRLGQSSTIDAVEYGTAVDIGGVRVSLHPAGHILGSAQVRVEHRGQVWVVSGDYKTGPDRTCRPFEPVRCHAFITESTFGLPIYRWRPQEEVYGEINAWWRENRAAGKASLLLGYALGKAQRLLAGLDPAIGPIWLHGAVARLTKDYRASGVELPPATYASEAPKGTDWSKGIILAPPSAHGTPWSRKFGPLSAGLASGWMAIRGTRRRKAVGRGFVFSDHADWPGLLGAIKETGAERVWVTHGYVAVLVRHLRELGLDASSIPTPFGTEEEIAEEEPA